jgi:hypothetical protein
MGTSFRIFRPCLNLLCIFLLLNQLTIQARADTPSRYTWQIERVEQSSATYIVNSFEGGTPGDPYGDIAWVKMDIPAQFFPLELWEIHSWHQNTAFYDHGLAAKFYLYRGSDGQAKYLFQHAVVVPGKNITRLRVECSECRAIFVPADGPNLGVGLMYVTEFEHPVWSGSSHIVVGNEGCWSGYDLVYDYSAQEWVNPCALGMPGNFAIRVVFEPLCPERLGDNDGDFDIDLHDYAMLQAAATGPTGDVFGTPAVYVDLNNDYAIDSDDLAILAGNFTGPDNDVVCPEFPAPGLPLDSALQFSTSLADHPAGPLRLPAELPTDGLRWTYVDVAVGLVLASLLAMIIGPCVGASCRQTGAVGFATGHPNPTEAEADRIRLAIDRIGQLPGQLSEDCYFYLSQGGWYNPEVFGLIRINRSVSEDDVAYAATHALNRITIHQSFFDGDRWDQWGIDGLALLLFSEWQHINGCGAERDCQEQLMQWRQEVGFEDIAPEFGHGFGD